MYSILKSLEIDEQVELLTRELVKMKSYNSTDGERNKADFILEIIQSFPYFSTHKKFAWSVVIENDMLNRKNVFAFIKGKNDSNRTIIYHAHLDTVGTEDFGGLQSIAHDPVALQEFYSNYEADKEVQTDALSGEWLFGRGALDMQSGIAVHLANLLYFSQHPEELNGNLLIMFNPDEENQHTGIRTSLTELKKIQAEHSLDYVAAINNDFISPLYDGDITKYIYTGVAGKLLPCFHIFGREAHVGDNLSAIDPTLIASELNLRIGQNLELSEKIQGEVILPPTCLYLRDDKKSYDVQTAVSTKLYFNYFVYTKTPQQVLDELYRIAVDVCNQFESTKKSAFHEFCQMTDLPKRDLEWKLEVIKLEDYITYLEECNLSPQKVINDTLNKFKQDIQDDRMLAFKIVEALHLLDPEKKPRVILFFAPPFLPSNFLKEADQKGEFIYKSVRTELEQPEYKEVQFTIKKYFPFLSDGSFLSYNGSEDDIVSIKNNFPAMDELFHLPLREMKELDIPSINLGVYGKGGHQWTERVYKPYSFNVLPKLIRSVTKRLL
ncbi:M20/M25/M40 family metallo-hydrolase [Bacillus luteolus]|uniref:M20/M25/M40 family metallo-hydrolase n=1 Tax=Litchfieldia luteola TaxID=682179 RepID=A0ABR9QQ74_9BACI|nr:M20/M25/M40 family metallo-hydrolase [Cytobacillus luteolus]MBE4910650.1 M20/M25/M40 family metallo-hydrolase [Cytobacillus luteolus]MBP1943829.1 arginine utilization protein RocB [Cytobacillus luteolus]